MKFLKYLNEEYFSLYNGGVYGTTEIFKNPNRKELYSFPMIRFMVDIKNDDLYVWNGEKILHQQMSDHLYGLGIYNEYDPPSPKFIWGQAEKKDGKITVFDCRMRYGRPTINKIIKILNLYGIEV